MPAGGDMARRGAADKPGPCYGSGMVHHRLSPSEERLLEEFRRRLLAAAPGQVASIRVFGSRARGASHEGSDLDVAVEPGPGVEPNALRHLAVEVAWDAMEALGLEALMLTPTVVPMVDGGGLAEAIAREGITLWRAEAGA